MELAKCPFMGGKQCIAAECALWVRERAIKTDFQVAGSRWEDREYVLPGHCSMNKEQAETRVFSRLTEAGAAEDDASEQETVTERNSRPTEAIFWQGSVYER